jgi:conjugal transfer pilus assembly protein TraB
MNLKSQNILKNQKIILTVIICGLFAIAILLFYVLGDDTSKHTAMEQHKLELPGDKINPQEMWMARLDNENKMLKKQLEFLETTLLEIKKNQDDKIVTNDGLKKEVVKLKDELKTALLKPFSNDKSKSNQNEAFKPTQDAEINIPNSSRIEFTEDPFVSQQNRSEIIGLPNRSVFKEVVMGKPKRNVFHVDKAIPAGTSVKALLVSSIDATCGIYSRSDPQPVKLRILDNGHLPKEVEAKLKGGLIIASAFGDISTERVYMRIERLSKVEANGEFLETSVTGFVSGEDGKFGVRGEVVDKSEKIVANAARSGFLGGLGSILQSAVTKHDVNEFSFDLIKQSCASGASSAFDMLADYYIKRAEQVMPVIQVTAGRIVDITFTHQTELGDLYTKDKVKEIRENSRRS